MSYGWVINKDHIFDRHPDNSSVGLKGPAGLLSAIELQLDTGEGRRFRMRDGDFILYYEGRLVGGDGFEPLDDFGTPDSGCTSIEYLQNGIWEIL